MIFVPTKYAETVLTSEYIGGNEAIVDHFVANNVDTLARTLTLHVVPSGGTVGATNKVCVVTIEPGSAYLCPEIVGDVIHAGESIHVMASAATAIVIRATGRTR